MAVDAPPPEEDDALPSVLEGGAEVLGSLPGGAVGFAIAGPPGALIGGAITPIVTRALKAAIGAGLAYRARDRAAGAALLVEKNRRRRAAEGDSLRDDGFFEADGRLRPRAEELLEGVLREAAQAFEERKVPLIANLYSAVEHDETIPAADALLLLRRAGQLTYREFVAVSVFEHCDRYADFLIQTEAMHGETSGHPGGDPALDVELTELATFNLLGTQDTSGQLVPLGATWGGIGNIPSKVGLGRLRLLPAGLTLARITDVANVISDEERDAWLERLRGPNAW